MFISHEQRSY